MFIRKSKRLPPHSHCSIAADHDRMVITRGIYSGKSRSSGDAEGSGYSQGFFDDIRAEGDLGLNILWQLSPERGDSR